MSPPAHRVDSLRGRDCSRRSEALPMLTAEKTRPYMLDVVDSCRPNLLSQSTRPGRQNERLVLTSAMFIFRWSKTMMLKLPVGRSKKMSNMDIMTSMATLG